MKAFSKGYMFLEIRWWHKSMEMILAAPDTRLLGSTTVLFSLKVITVSFNPQAVKMAREEIVIYGNKYLTSLYLNIDLDMTFDSWFQLCHHSFLCNPEINTPQCKVYFLFYFTYNYRYSILSYSKQGINQMAEDYNKGLKGCQALVTTKEKAKKSKAMAYKVS
jgi:hypothetical protein